MQAALPVGNLPLPGSMENRQDQLVEDGSGSALSRHGCRMTRQALAR